MRIMEKYPELLDMPDELSVLKKAKRVAQQTIDEDVTKLKRGVDGTKAGVKLANDDGDVAFSQAITPFLNTAEATLSAIQLRSSEIKEQFVGICNLWAVA